MATNEDEARLLIDLDTEQEVRLGESAEIHTVDEEAALPIDLDTEQKVTPATVEDTPEQIIRSKLKVVNETEQDKLVKITITKEIFEQIRKSLQDTVKSLEKNPSMFSRAAEYWGELPLWQKIIGGVALTVPTLILGIVAHIGFLLAICGVTALTYAAGGIILDDHHKCSTSAVESLQKGILGLADLLELTINALDIIRQQLAIEIKKFTEENAKFKAYIEELSKKIDAIDKQVMATARINDTLTETKDGLVEVSGALKEGVERQSDLMQQNQEKLDRITEGYRTAQEELVQKVREVKQVRHELGQDLDRAKAMIDSLHTAITKLSVDAIGNEEQRKAFQEKLDIFIKNKEVSFLLIADRICEAERRLAIVQKELERSNDRYQELLKVQERHIDTLKSMSSQASADQAPSQAKLQDGRVDTPQTQEPIMNPVSMILDRIGLHAQKEPGGKPGAERTPTPQYS
ncbi:inclusion membrane protein A [Legionella steelei]|uniref:Inclusion membrane protein A n=1 Tax=Legionella steelei TaxID=947033 RepID=A0A0W0ZJ32_9GAMM|nr:LegC2/C7 family Dot/Icm T4SS effector [Legionella steelei]KTD69420.1 inclusion membrane protein A [Legionella steelei]